MIAHVYTHTRPAGPDADEMRTFLEAAISQARAFDGCEGVVAKRDPITGDSLAVNLFRDQAAIDAWQTFANEQRVEGEKFEAPIVPATRVYTDVIARL